MKAGELKNRITLERPRRIANALGESVITWEPAADVWAMIRPLGVAETARARQAQLTTSHLVVLRYHPDLAADWRITWNDRIFNIAGITNVDEANTEHRLQAVEVTTGG